LANDWVCAVRKCTNSYESDVGEIDLNYIIHLWMGRGKKMDWA
jgi:hypothetical protein